MPDPIKSLFEATKSKKIFLDEADFKSQLSKDPQGVFNAVSDTKLFMDFDDFQNTLGLKKKDGIEGLSTTAQPAGEPSAPTSQSASISTAEPQPKKLTFTDIERLFESVDKREARLRSMKKPPSYTASTAGAIPAMPFTQDEVAAASKELEFAKKQKEIAEKRYKNEIVRPVDKLFEDETWKVFFKGDVLDRAKASEHFDNVIKLYGGGSNLKDVWISELNRRGQFKKDERRIGELQKDEFKKAGIDLEKYGEKLFGRLSKDQYANVENIQSEIQNQSSAALDNAKAKIENSTNTFNSLVKSLEEQVKAKVITPEAAAETYDQELKKYNDFVKQQNDEYKAKLRSINVSANKKYGKIKTALDNISEDITFDKILADMPESERNKVKQANENVFKRLSQEKNEAKKLAIKALGNTPFSDEISVLIDRGLRSGINRGLASIGNALHMNNFDNGVVDWLRNRASSADELAIPRYEWNKKEWLKRAVGSTAESLGISASTLLPTIGVAALTKSPAAGTLATGITGFLGENATIAGLEYEKQLANTGDPQKAKEAAINLFNKNTVALPFYFVGGLGAMNLLKGKGLIKKLAGAGLEQVEEIPTEYIQSYNEAVNEGYKKSFGTFVKENPSIAADVAVSTIGQSGVTAAIGNAFKSFDIGAKNPTTQYYTDLINKFGVNGAQKIVEKFYTTGVIDKTQYQSQLQEVTRVATKLNKLSDVGVEGNKAKLMTYLSDEASDLKTKIQSEQDDALKAIYKNDLTGIEEDIKGLANNQTPYVVFNMPGDQDASRVMTVRDFNMLKNSEVGDDMIRSANTIEVFNNPELQKEIDAKKVVLGNPANAPEGLYTNGITEKRALRDALKQKFNLTDADFVAEPFTVEEDVADREALPQSEFTSEQELEAALNTGEFAMLTGMNPQAQQVSKSANKVLNEKAQQWLADRGLKPVAIYGKYDNSERSFYVPNMTKEQAIEFAKEFDQDSVAHSSGLVYQDGSFRPRSGGVEIAPQFGTEGANNFSSINIGGKPVDFKVGYDFNKRYSADGKLIEGEEAAIDKRLSEEMGGDIDTKVESAQKALEATGVKITMIDNTADFEAAVASRKGPAGVEGVFLSDTGEILINKELLAKGISDGRVIWHEASHPVINIVRNTNPQLFDQVVSGLKQAAADNAEIAGVLQWANDNYGTEGDGVVNDEAVNELIANIAEGVVDIQKVPTGLKQAIIDLINKIAQALGFDPVLSDTDVAAFKKLTSDVANALTTGRDISEIVGEDNVAEIGASVGEPTQLRKAEPKGEPVTVGADYKLSFVKESDLIDINGLIKDIQDKGQKVWFWVADQLGRGMYYDKVIDGEHYLDAGPSYALDPENRDKNIIWASGMPKARAEKLINDSDYIFIISGSPTKSKLFNKRVAELVINRIKNVVGEENTYAKFKKQVLKASKVSALNKLVGEFNSFEELLESPRRKDFLNMINDQKEKKGTDLKKLLDKYNAFVDYNELSDDFYRENGFEQNDIMLVLKPTGVGGKSAHSTYENDILGDVVGVPDRKINSYDIMPDEIRNEYGELPRAQQSQVVAPYGAGVRKVQARKGNLVAEAGLNKQMTSDDKGNYLFYHYSDRKLKTISPSKFGKNLATGRDERPGIGISMYYTRPDILEAGVPSDYGFAVRVPENKVYPFNEDPLDLLPTAEKEFSKKFPGQAFDFNKQVAFVTQEAAKRGYPMTVAQWNIRGTKALRAQTTEEFKPEMYRELVPGTMNQYEYNPEIDKFKPNAKRRGQASVGKRDLDNRLKAFAQRERELGTSDQEIEQAIRNRFPLMDQARIDEIMAKPTVAQPTVEEKLETVVQPEGKEKVRGMEKRFGELDEDTYDKIKDEARKYFSQPNKQTEKAAEEFMKGKSLQYLADLVTTDVNIPGAVHVWLAAMTAKQLGTEIDAAKKAGDVNKVEMLSAARANIYNYFSAKATELGQTIQAFVSFKNDPAANQFIFNKILKQLEEKGVTGISEDQKTEIKKLLDDVSTAPTGLPKDIAITKLSHYLAKMAPINAFDVAQAIWYAKILSGITTQSKNFFANIFNTFLEVPIVGLRISFQTGSLQPMFYAMKGLGGGSLKGLVKAGDILKSGVTSKSEDKFFNNDSLLEYFKWSDTKLGKTFGGLTGKILDFPLFFETSPRALKYVGRALTASDAIFSTANQEAMANMMAFAQAKAEGKEGITNNTYKRVQEILNNTKQSVADAKLQATSEGFKLGTVQHKRRVIEIVNQQRGEEIVAKAEEFGKRATLTNEPEGFTRGIYQVATYTQEKLPLSRIVIPFTKIVSNMAENMINYSPAGLYRAITGTRNPKVKGVDKNRLSNDERADLFIKSMIGITALTILASKIGDDDDDWFDITAGGPSEYSKKYELMKGGWRPYTITFKDGTKVNYSDWPISGVFSALGTIVDAERYEDAESPSVVGKMITGAAGFLSVFYDKSLLKGMSDFFDIFKQDGKYGVGSENFIERTAKNTAKFGAQQTKAITMSNFSQQILKLTDEYKDDPINEAKGAEILYRDIPIVNDGLNPIIDVFGDPVVSATSERLLPWMSVSDDKKDSIIAYLNRNNIFVGMAPEKSFIDLNTGEERKMTRDELYNYRKLAGQYSKEMLTEYLETIKDVKAMEKDLGKGLAKDVVGDIVSAARERAYAEIIIK